MRLRRLYLHQWTRNNKQRRKGPEAVVALSDLAGWDEAADPAPDDACDSIAKRVLAVQYVLGRHVEPWCVIAFPAPDSRGPSAATRKGAGSPLSSSKSHPYCSEAIGTSGRSRCSGRYPLGAPHAGAALASPR